MKKFKIIIADDEPKIRALLGDVLISEGYEVLLACDGGEALKVFEQNQDATLVILDVMMPVFDGYEVCKRIRKISKIPIMILTAKSQEADELDSFEAGADDYISKPFSLAVLKAHVKALTGRKDSKDALLIKGALCINADTHEVTIHGEVINLTPIEYELLYNMAAASGKVFSREKLLTLVWGYDYFGGDRTVDTHMGRLRIKLGKYNDCIKTVRGYGYKFES